MRRIVLGRLSWLSKPREVDLSAHSSAVVMSLRDAAAPPRVVAFLNRCPHVGTPLNMFPERFMDRSGTHLHCATHGALFRPHDGLCVHGPCAGKHLTPIHALVESTPASAHADDPLVVLLVDERALAAAAPEKASRPSSRRAADAATRVQLPTRSAIDDEFDSVLRALDARRSVR